MRDKQIEEMEEIEKAAEWFERRAKSTPMQGARKMFELAAEALNNAGYRKKSDVAREVIDHIDGWFMYCEKYSGNVIKMRLAKLKKKYESEETK